MESTAFGQLFNADPYMVVLIALSILFVIKQVGALIPEVLKTLGLVRKQDIEDAQMKEDINNLNQELVEIKDIVSSGFSKIEAEVNLLKRDNENVAMAHREELADKLNDRYRRYFRLGYIPSDEIDEFGHLHHAYNLVGGNHTGDAKYQKCIDSLDVREYVEEDKT